jgi:hypothetical protein
VADLLAQFLPWLDEQKRTARNTLTNALASQGNPLQALVSAFTPSAQTLDSANQLMGGTPGLQGSVMDAPVDSAQRINAAAGFGGATPATLVRAFPEQVAAAQAMASAGHDANAIWKATGAQNVPNVGWIREIPDTGMSMRPSPPQTGTLDQFIDHPALFSDPAVGDLAATTGVMQKPASFGDAYYPSANTMKMGTQSPAAYVHETGHAVQTFQGLPNGSSPGSELANVMLQSDPTLDPANLKSVWEGMDQNARAPLIGQATLAYAQNPGEQMSRWTESRLNMTPDQLAAIPPSQSPDPYLYRLLKQSLLNPDAPPGAAPSPPVPPSI